jgi:hypothetical protein
MFHALSPRRIRRRKPELPLVRRNRRRTVGSFVTVCLLSGAVLVGLTGPSPAGAVDLVNFNAQANADGVRQTVTRPDAPLSSKVEDTAVPSAQASIDALGNSEAYGSFLYPGASALSGPGLASGVIAGFVPGTSVPSYPAIASSSSPSKPNDDASQGPVVIKASSTPEMSMGTSTFTQPGAGVGRLSALATVTADRSVGTLTATASSEATAVDVAGVLSMSSVKSKAEAHLVAGVVASSSSIEVGDLNVAGVRVVLTDKGLALPGLSQPLPDTSPVLKPLKDAGVTITLVQPEKLRDGARSAGVRVTRFQATPDGNSVTVDTVFGQTIAAISATVDQTSLDGPPIITPPPPSSGGTGGVVAPPPPTATLPAVSPVTPAPGGTNPQTVAPQPAAAPIQATPVSGVAPFARMDTLSFYLVLVLAGAVAFAAQKALRRFGVRSTWTS